VINLIIFVFVSEAKFVRGISFLYKELASPVKEIQSAQNFFDFIIFPESRLKNIGYWKPTYQQFCQ